MQTTFKWMAFIEMARGGAVAGLSGPFAYAAQIANEFASYEMMTVGIQYEVSPHRRLTTTIADDVGADLIPDLIGPGKGDIYFGEGWTLGLQTKYRVGIKLVTDSKGEPILDKQGKKQWTLHTEQIKTYDILERTNQYVYTSRDIENIISDLERTIPQTTDQNEKNKLTNARNTWEDLLNKNLAYIWNRDYVSQGISFEEKQPPNPLS